MKKALWIFGGLFFALIVAMVSIPLFVNVDQYRPEITAQVNKRINGTLELGKLNLSLWGAIKIHAESIQLKVNGFPEAFVAADRFHLEIPFSSIFSGRPQVVAVLSAPNIRAVKETDGRLNALELMKVEQPETAAPSAPASPTASSPSAPAETAPPTGESEPALVAEPAGSEPTKLPALLAGATLGLRIEKGGMNYSDKGAQSNYAVNGLELEAKNLGLGSAMTIRLMAPVEGKTPSMTFSGPIKAFMELTPILVGTQVKSVKGSADIDATALAIDMPGTFRKTSAMKMTAKAKIDGNETETLIRQLDIQFHEFKINATGRFTAEPVSAKMDLNAHNLRLDQVKDFSPLAAAYDLKGAMSVNAVVDMTADALKASGDLKVADGAFFYKDVFQAPMQFVVQAGFTESSLNIIRAGLAGPETDLQLTGSVRNFLEPQFSLAVSGKSFNVDKTLVLPAAKSAMAPRSSFLQLIPTAHAQGKKEEMNPMAEMAANPMFAKAAGTFTAKIGKVTAYGTSLDQVQARADLRNLVLRLQEASLRTFGGQVSTTGEFDLKHPRLNFTTRGKVEGISGKEAFATYFPKYQNTLEGKVNADWNITGSAYPESARIRSLKGSAKLLASDGALKSIDFQQTINSAMQKVPFLKDKKPLELDDGFKTLSANLTFNNGVVRADPIDIQPRGKGFVVKGSSTIQESLEQESLFEIFDPQGRLPKEFQKPGKPALSLRLTGPLNAPKPDFEYTVKRLASTAGTNVVKDAAGKALDRVLGGSSSGEGGGKGDPLKDAADKLKKKFKLF